MSEMALQLIAQAKKERWKRLDLGRTGILGAVPHEVGELEHLEELILSDKWWDNNTMEKRFSQNKGPENYIFYSPAHPPQRLAILIASGTQVADIEPLKGLTALQTLDLSFTRVADIEPLKGLTALQTLYLSSTQIADIEPLKGLKALQTLDLSSTQIADIVPLKGLTTLKWLDLSSKQVADIEPLKGLTALKWLDLSSTQVADIETLKGLTALKWLDLSSTQVADIEPLKGLTALQTLDLSSTQIAEIEPLKGLTALQTLYLSSTQVADIEPLKELTALQTLDLSSTEVPDIRPLKGLSTLQTLDLSHTQVADIKPLKGLTTLQTVDLRNTKVADIEPLKGLIKGDAIVKMSFDGLQGIFLVGCPLTNPPLEIVAQGNEAILWFLEGGEDVPVAEAKVLLVGDPNSGKTTLYRRMYEPHLDPPKPEDRTPGIDIHPQKCTAKDGQSLRLNIWDFGGQEILHSTHQFFLTKRSVYILLINGSQNLSRLSDEYFRKWLGWIHLLGGESPILFFQNQIGGFGEQIGIVDFQAKFDQIKVLFAGDLLNQPDSAIPIREALEGYVKNLAIVNSNWKKRHLRIREELEALPKNKRLIPWSEFREICGRHGESTESGAMKLSQYFHDLGICLHYHEEMVLAQHVIIDNEWATQAVYHMMIDQPLRFENHGRFTAEDQRRVWNSKEHQDHHLTLVALMEKFELCYVLQESTPKTWLVPQYLGPNKPNNFTFKDESTDLVLRYQYGYVPKGILNRLMTRLNKFVLDPTKAWKDGVIFEKNGCQVLATLNLEGDEVVFRAKGHPTERLKFLSIVTDDLETIHSKFENIEVEKLIPCRCETCLLRTDPHAYRFNDLMEMKLEGEAAITVQCNYKPWKKESVEKLLDGFETTTTANGQPAPWLLQKQLQDIKIEIRGGFGRMDGRFDRVDTKLDIIEEYTGTLPLVMQKLRAIKEFQSTIFLDLKQMGERIEGKIEKNHNEAAAFLAEMEAALADALDQMSPEAREEFEELVAEEPKGIAKTIVDRIKFKIPVIPIGVTLLTQGQDIEMTMLAAAMSRSVEFEMPLPDAVNRLVNVWRRLNLWTRD